MYAFFYSVLRNSFSNKNVDEKLKSALTPVKRHFAFDFTQNNTQKIKSVKQKQFPHIFTQCLISFLSFCSFVPVIYIFYKMVKVIQTIQSAIAEHRFLLR